MSTGNARQRAFDLIMCVRCLTKDGEICEFCAKKLKVEVTVVSVNN